MPRQDAAWCPDSTLNHLVLDHLLPLRSVPAFEEVLVGRRQRVAERGRGNVDLAPVFPYGHVDIHAPERAAFAEENTDALGEVVVRGNQPVAVLREWHMQVVDVETAERTVRVLHSHQTGESPQRLVGQFDASVIDLIRVAVEQGRPVDLVMPVVGRRQPQPEVLKARQRIGDVRTDVGPLAAQLDPRRMVVR